MNRRLIVLVTLIALAIFSIGFYIKFQQKSNIESNMIDAAEAANEPIITNFELPTVYGQKIELKDVVRSNKVVLLNFFATWCPPCRAETPDFVKFYNSYKDKGVEIVSVNLRENAKTVKAFMNQYGIKYKVLLDTSGEVADTYGVYSIPSTFVIDSKGRIVKSFLGLTQETDLKKAVDLVLNQ